MSRPIDLRVQQLKLELNPKFTKHDAVFWAMPSARALASGRALFHGLARSATSIAIAATYAITGVYAASLWVLP